MSRRATGVVSSAPAATARLPYPPDTPDALDRFADGLSSIGATLESHRATMSGVRADVAQSWEGLAADAAATTLATLVDDITESADAAQSSVDAVLHYREVIVEARTRIDELREEQGALMNDLALLEADVHRTEMLPALIDPAVRQTQVRQAHTIVDRMQRGVRSYREVMLGVRDAADACSQELLQLSGREAGLARATIATELIEPREDPNDRILHEYQVSDDPDGRIPLWTPSGLNGFLAGIFGKGSVELKNITAHEGEMLDALLPGDLYVLSGYRDEAEAVAKERFPQPDGNPWNDHADAFRHAYWNALQTRWMGSGWTEEYTTAHERLRDRSADTTAEEEAMDLYNNEVGRRIAEENPYATQEEVADLIEDAVNNGQLLVIGQGGELYWSNEIPIEDAGGLGVHDAPLPGEDPHDPDEY